MILETAQMLSTAHRVLDKDTISEEMSNSIYKEAYKNHPCTVWIRESKSNYLYAFYLFDALLYEYQHRFNKVHGSSQLLEYLCNFPKALVEKGLTQPAQAMPDQYKNPADSILAYRSYYNNEKRHLFRWSKRRIPNWVVPSITGVLNGVDVNVY
jgi:hypothetical protein